MIPPARALLPPNRRAALAASVFATLIAMGAMFGARSLYQIRSLPERVMEWALLFIPLNLFEKGLQTFGATAKDFALVAAVIGMAAILIVVGFVAVRSSRLAILAAAVGIWLFAMAVVLPVTGAGFFATGLFQDVLLTNVSYLAVALAYGTALLLARLVLAVPRGSVPAAGTVGPAASDARVLRRSFVGGLAATGVAAVATAWLGRTAGTTGSDLPLASVSSLPTPAALPPTAVPPTTAPAATAPAESSAASAPSPIVTPAASTPTAAEAVGTAAPTAVGPTTAPAAVEPTTAAPAAVEPTTAAPTAVMTATPAPATATAIPTPAPSIAIPPAPGPLRQVARDKDGALAGAVPPPGQVSSLYTPNLNFYITTKNAAGDPVVDPLKWRLAIDGEVGRPVQLDLPLLYQLPTVEVTKTLECISNFVKDCETVPFGCNLISNATWKGVRLSDLLALAGGLKGGVQSIGIFSVDEYVASIPPDPALLQSAVLAFQMNGSVLPLEHGYPARLLTPGRYGMKSPKWVVGIRPMRAVLVDWFGQRGWNHDAVVHTMTRIDTPLNGQTLPAGEQTIGGIAYGGGRGISRVEFSVDGGNAWRVARFLDEPAARDEWVRWQATFTMPTSGSLQLTARSVDGDGNNQITASNPTQPNGATGLRTIVVRAG